MDAGKIQGVRGQLAATVASAAGPYGYTISLGASTAMTVRHAGAPNLGDALLLMAGAVLGFVLLEAVAFGSLMPQDSPPDRPPSILGNAHILSAGGAICAVWGLVQVVHGAAAWAVTGFVATTLYFAATALQQVLAHRIRRRPR